MIRFLWILLSVFFSSAQAQSIEGSLDVAVNVSLRDGRPHGAVLAFEIVNRSAVDVEVYRRSLPWVLQRSVILAAVAIDQPRDAITRLHAFQTPTNETIRIRAGMSVVGEIPLASEFHNFSEINAKTPIVVFWSYQLESVAGLRSPIASGSVVVRPR